MPPAEYHQLQWGRNMIVAEGFRRTNRAARAWRRLQWGRNMIVAEGPMTTRTKYLGLWLQWGRNMIVAEGRLRLSAQPPCQASMGPQHDSCGRNKAARDRGRDPDRFNGAAT